MDVYRRKQQAGWERLCCDRYVRDAGTLGTASADNLPEGRYGGMGWTDANGNLWMFGGFNYDTNPGMAALLTFDDAWEFNTKSKE